MSGYVLGMSKILVIYDLIPEETSFYLVPEKSLREGAREALEAAHNAIGSAVEITDTQAAALEVVSSMCCSEPKYASKSTPADLVGFLVPFKIEGGAPPPQPVSAVFYCGWYL